MRHPVDGTVAADPTPLRRSRQAVDPVGNPVTSTFVRLPSRRRCDL
jgi:hypothetical protein